MKARTTIMLLFSVLLLGAYIWFVERESGSTAERAAEMRRAIQIDPASVTVLQVQFGDMNVEVEKRSEGWVLTQPMEARADAGKIDRMLAGLGRLQGSAIAAGGSDERIDLAEYGLAEPRMVLSLVESGRAKSYSIGRDAPVGSTLYVLVKETGRVLAADTNLLTMLPQRVEDLRDRRLFVGGPEQVSRIEIRGAGGFMQLARAVDGTWSIQQPINARAGREAVRKLLDAAFRVRVEQFVTDELSDGAVFGLADDASQITVSSEGQEAQTLFIGGPVNDDALKVYARIDSSDSIYAVPKDVADILGLGVEEVRDRRLVNLYPYQIAYIRCEQGESYLDLLKKKEGEWWVVYPKQYPADLDRVDALLATWSSARIESFVDGARTNITDYGFDEVERTIELARRVPPTSAAAAASFDEDRVRVQLGKVNNERGMVVRIEGEPALYRVSDKLLKQFSIDPLAFRAREVMALTADNVESIELTRNGLVQTVARQASGGFVAANTETARVMRTQVESVLNAVEHLEAVRFIADSPDDLDAYGLEEPKVVVALGLRGDGAIRKSVLIGEALKGGGSYAMVRGDDVVFVMADDTVQALNSPLLEGIPPESHEKSGDGEKQQSERE